MPESPRIYLDNAATSWPKPEAVYKAVDRYQRDVGAPAGRSAYRTAAEVQRAVEGCRTELAALLSVENAERLAFTFNGSDALNIAIQGCVSAGDHVVTTEAEHNSVLRPLRYLEENRSVEVTRIPCDAWGLIDPADVAGALQENTRLVVLTHASNVTGTIQPVKRVSEILKEHQALLLVDAAQTLGHRPVDLTALGADLVASPGHKGLLGPLGTGLLYIAPGVEQQVDGLRYGGTGSQSEDDRHPLSLPEKFEAGNHNVPGIVGLRSGIAYLKERGLEEIHQHITTLTKQLLDGIREIEGVTIHGPEDLAESKEVSQTAGLVSITVAGYDPQEVAAALDSGYGIQVRSGLHCAPLIHKRLGTFPSGTVRFSMGPFSTSDEIDISIQAVREIATAAMPI